MATFLGIADLIVFAVLFLHVLWAVWNGSSKNVVSRVIVICLAIVLVVFGIISVGVAGGFASDEPLTVLASIVAIAVLLAISWTTKTGGTTA